MKYILLYLKLTVIELHYIEFFPIFMIFLNLMIYVRVTILETPYRIITYQSNTNPNNSDIDI